MPGANIIILSWMPLYFKWEIFYIQDSLHKLIEMKFFQTTFKKQDIEIGASLTSGDTILCAVWNYKSA